MTIAPTIETARLVLRPHDWADFPAYLAVMQSERARFMGGPMSLKQAWFCFASDVAQWPLKGCGALAVTLRETDVLVGQVALNDIPHFPERELGWMALEAHEGKGYLTEAARALRNFAARTLGWKTLVSYISAGNTRSARLAERLGALLDPTAARLDADDLVYRHPMEAAAWA